MRRFRRQLARPLLLVFLLALGPLNAQTMFACSLTGVAIFETCCCSDNEPADVTLDTERDPCCEETAILVVDPDAPDLLKPVDVRPDIDPPLLIAVSDVAVLPYAGTSSVSGERITTASYKPSKTYLATQRLRL